MVLLVSSMAICCCAGILRSHFVRKSSDQPPISPAEDAKAHTLGGE